MPPMGIDADLRTVSYGGPADRMGESFRRVGSRVVRQERNREMDILCGVVKRVVQDTFRPGA